MKQRFDSQVMATEDVKKVSEEVLKTISLVKEAIYKSEQKCEYLKMKQDKQRYQLLAVMRKIELLRCQGVPLDKREKRYRRKIRYIKI